MKQRRNAETRPLGRVQKAKDQRSGWKSDHDCYRTLPNGRVSADVTLVCTLPIGRVSADVTLVCTLPYGRVHCFHPPKQATIRS